MQKIKKVFNKCKNKIMKKLTKENLRQCLKSSILILCFVLSATLNALLLRTYTIGNTTDLQPLFADLGILLFIGSIAFFIKPKKRIRYLMVFSIITTAICIIDSIYYTYYSSFPSLSMLATSSQVVDVGDAVVKNVLQIKDFTYLWQPIFIYYIHVVLMRRNHYKEESKIEQRVNFGIGASLAAGIFLITLTTFSSTDWSRFSKLWNREFVVLKFGVYTYHVNDLFQSLEPKFSNLFGHDEALKNVTAYFEENKQETKINKYTNIFEGKNIIMIHAESIQGININRSFNGEEVTPCLNRLSEEGIYFSNFYSQVGIGTSSDSEFTLATSLMPSSSGAVFVSYFDRKYISIQNLLKDKGYYVFAMHGNTGDFWNRNIMYQTLGYDKYYSKSSYTIDEKIGLGLSDKSFFTQAVPYIKNEVAEGHTPFMVNTIMLSNHTPFDDLGLMDDFPVDYKVEINGEVISRPYLEGTTLGNYFKSVHYADQAIELYLNKLDKEGLLDNAVVVIYGDHDAKLSKKYYNIMYNYDPYQDRILEEGDEGYVNVDYYKYELDRKVPFIIWTKDQKFNEEVTEPMGMIDVAPTLGNMFNFKNEYQLGHDIFSTEDNMVVFGNGNYLTSKLYYNNQKEEAYLFDQLIEDDYIKNHATKASKIIEVSNDIINYDLIKKLEEKEKIMAKE